MGVFEMPSLGADMEAGTLVEWMIKPGDTVKRGDVVAVVETQKGAIEIETFQAGTVHHLEADLGQKLPVGAPLAVILGDGEEAPPEPVAAPKEVRAEPAPPEAPEPPSPPEPVAAPAMAPAPPAPALAVPPPAGLMASPVARRRAAELGVDLAKITGTGLGGAIQLADVERAHGSASETEPVATTSEQKSASPMAEMRKAIAAAMSRSKREIPHLYVSQTLDLEPATHWLAKANQERDPTSRLLMGALFVRATVLAATKVPVVNGQYLGDPFEPSTSVHAGVAVALRGGGLVAPALMNAGSLSLDDTMAGMRDLVTRARAGRLRGSEMTMGTITISALGETGTESMTGVIFPPQVALLCIGAPQRRPWVVGDHVEPRATVTVTLSLDHRIGDGRQASRFLDAFESFMQAPETL
ncbi:MAG: dihydrolipoamide acetyltransferase family protein [Hyphomicrobiales bacterium]